MSSLTRGTRLARRTSTAAVALLTSVALPGIASAQSTDIAALEAQVQALSAEVQALKASQAAVQQQGGLTQDAIVAETTGVPIALQPKVQAPPSPGVAGQPFFAELPEGRTTGIMATGNDTVRLTFSGQINRALNIIDDGIDTDVYQVDNENASSRFRFIGETSPFRETQAVSLFEFEWPANGSLDVNQLEPNVPDALNKTLNLRLLEVGFSNNRYGSFFIGKGWMASDGTSETDISGITTPAWVGQTFAYGGMLPTQNNADLEYVPRGTPPDPDDFDSQEEYEAALGDFSVVSSNFVNVFSLGNDLDGLSRQQRIRYNTPIFGGFQFSTSAAVDDLYDAAIRYGGNTSWARFAAAASWWTDAGDGGYEGYSGSASMLLTDDDAWWGGLSLTVSAAQQDFDDQDNTPLTYYGKLAYTDRFFDIGRTGFAIMYSRNEDFRVTDETMDIVTVGFSQNVDALGTELYAGFTNTTFDNPDIDYNDMNMVQVGAMIRF